MLARVESELHRGQAHDTLEKLHMAICVYNYNYKFKCDHVWGQRPNTRAENYLKTLEQDKKWAAEIYRHAYSALSNLGLNDSSLQPLHDNQLIAKDTSKPAKLGDNQKEDPWFWRVEHFCNQGDDNQEWVVESKCVSHVHARQYNICVNWD